MKKLTILMTVWLTMAATVQAQEEPKLVVKPS